MFSFEALQLMLFIENEITFDTFCEASSLLSVEYNGKLARSLEVYVFNVNPEKRILWC